MFWVAGMGADCNANHMLLDVVRTVPGIRHQPKCTCTTTHLLSVVRFDLLFPEKVQHTTGSTLVVTKSAGMMKALCKSLYIHQKQHAH